MKNTILKITALVTLASLGSCDDYLDVNKNPNSPEDVTVDLLMANASFRTGDNIQLAGNITSYYVQYLASPNAFGTKDIHDQAAYDVTWREMYRMLSDLSDMETRAGEEGSTQYIGAAKILKAVNLGLVVNLWGDVPYSDAFLGLELRPVYDDDEELYNEIIKLLDEGIAEISKAESVRTLGSDDFIYGGNIDRWKKMAYSLKARYLLHMSGTSKFDANAVLNAAASGITTNADNADITYSNQGPDVYNPWAKIAIDQEESILDGWISEQLADAMNGSSYPTVDPRLPFMFSATDDGEFIGVSNGTGRGSGVDIEGERSVIARSTYYAANTSPILIITLAEMKFIEAEAHFRNSNLLDAYNAYLAGIRAHMEMVGVETDDIDDYIADPSVSVGDANITLALIMKEKYVAMFLHPEAWNDARRFDYQYKDMTLPANHNPDLGGQFIRRLAYPDSETSRNNANVPPGITLLDRIWWDQ